MTSPLCWGRSIQLSYIATPFGVMLNRPEHTPHRISNFHRLVFLTKQQWVGALPTELPESEDSGWGSNPRPPSTFQRPRPLDEPPQRDGTGFEPVFLDIFVPIYDNNRNCFHIWQLER